MSLITSFKEYFGYTPSDDNGINGKFVMKEGLAPNLQPTEYAEKHKVETPPPPPPALLDTRTITAPTASTHTDTSPATETTLASTTPPATPVVTPIAPTTAPSPAATAGPTPAVSAAAPTTTAPPPPSAPTAS